MIKILLKEGKYKEPRPGEELTVKADDIVVFLGPQTDLIPVAFNPEAAARHRREIPGVPVDRVHHRGHIALAGKFA